jgi:hypothetical protein
MNTLSSAHVTRTRDRLALFGKALSTPALTPPYYLIK